MQTIEHFREQRRKYYSQHVQRKKAEGWRFVNWQLPPEVLEKVQAYKCKLMEEYKANR